jgi:aspartyl-tRNA(Asn)/glutamyl-tRNA(Gln) amidotransferase subunit C
MGGTMAVAGMACARGDGACRLSGTFFAMAATEAIHIDHLANLSRLALTPEEKTKFTAQIGDILGYIEKLKEVNVEGVEPTAHATPIFNVLQADVPREGLAVEAALRNAPAQRDNMVVVPRVVE